MPVVKIKNLGEVEYTRAALPPDIKGKTFVGFLESPIWITEELSPGAKLEHVVAHEAGHRLTIEMAILAISSNPHLLDNSKGTASALTHYFIQSGLEESNVIALHPGVKQQLSRIFQENRSGDFTEEVLAREFVSEVFANWATGEGRTPPPIDAIFSEIMVAKEHGSLPPLSQSVSPIARYKQENLVYSLTDLRNDFNERFPEITQQDLKSAFNSPVHIAMINSIVNIKDTAQDDEQTDAILTSMFLMGYALGLKGIRRVAASTSKDELPRWYNASNNEGG